MQGIKDLADQKVLGDPGTIVSSIYSANKSHWLINKPYVGECGRCLLLKKKKKKLCTAAPQSLYGSSENLYAVVPYLYPLHGPSDMSMCRFLRAVCCCWETSFSPSSIVGDMGWCRICLGRFNISQGATYIGMGNVEVQTSLVPPEMTLVPILGSYDLKMCISNKCASTWFYALLSQWRLVGAALLHAGLILPLWFVPWKD